MATPLEPGLAHVLEVFRRELIDREPAVPTVSEQRRRHERQVAMFTPPPARPVVGSVEDDVVPGPVGPLPVRIYRPVAGDRHPVPTMVWLHGGGWVTGGLETADVLAREACAAGMVVVSVDYRLAPEALFPAAVDDCLTALRWAHGAAGRLGGDARLLGVGGDSAGGNLAAVLAQQARGLDIDLAVQVLLYPVVDLRPDHGRRYPSRAQNGDGPLLSTADLERLVASYLGPRSPTEDPRASPIRSADLSQVAPAVVVTAELDLLRDEGDAYAEALRAAGVTVRHHRAAGLPHCVFDMLAAAPLARAHVSRALGDARALAEHAVLRTG